VDNLYDVSEEPEFVRWLLTIRSRLLVSIPYMFLHRQTFNGTPQHAASLSVSFIEVDTSVPYSATQSSHAG
jgi:hypothetical protein